MAKKAKVKSSEVSGEKNIIKFSQLNARDSNIFVATELDVQSNGFVKAVGSFKRQRKIVTLLIPNTSIISIQKVAISSSEEEGEEGSEEKV